MLINTTNELEHVCNELIMMQPKFIAVDTEFIRNLNEYYPKLCLIQIAYCKKRFVIDVLASGIDLSILESIFYNENIVKVFHDCKQDVDALLTKFPKVPFPIFDTQVAAMFCYPYDNAVGYSKLVEQFLGISLDKLTLKRSNWMLRPLSDDKIEYALNDVIYLYKLYHILYDKLVSSDKLSWFLEEMDSILLQEISYTDVESITDSASNITKTEIIFIKSIVEWREKLAQFFNVNRDLILKNKLILCLARDLIKNNDISTLSRYIRKEYLLYNTICNIFDIIDYNHSINLDELYVVNANTYDKSVLNILLILLYNVCCENNISQKLVSSKNGLVKFLNGKFSYIMKGWRYEFFGCKVEKFMQGKSKIVVSAQALDNHIDIVTTLTKM